MDLTEKGSKDTPFLTIKETNGRITNMQHIYLPAYQLHATKYYCPLHQEKLPLNNIIKTAQKLSISTSHYCSPWDSTDELPGKTAVQ